MSDIRRRSRHWPVDPQKYPLSGPSKGPVYTPERPPIRKMTFSEKFWWAAFFAYCVFGFFALNWALAHISHGIANL